MQKVGGPVPARPIRWLRPCARIFRIADIIGYIDVFCNFSVVDCDLLQLQQRLLLPYL